LGVRSACGTNFGESDGTAVEAATVVAGWEACRNNREESLPQSGSRPLLLSIISIALVFERRIEMDLKNISIRPESWHSRVCTGLILVTCIGTQTVAWAQPDLSFADDPALSKQLRRVDQDKLLRGDYPLRQVVEVGRHLFSTPFTKAEGYGEGGRPDGKGGVATGPREEMFQQNLEKLRQDLEKLCQGGKSNLTVEHLRQVTNFPLPEVSPNTGKIVFPYVRLNGLDSQSCFECHNSIGSDRLPDTRTFALTRKQTTVGGPAGFASNAFINDDLPNPIFMFVRNPPHVFGIGYAQDLAEEMTQVLLFLRSKAPRGPGSSQHEDHATAEGQDHVVRGVYRDLHGRPRQQARSE